MKILPKLLKRKEIQNWSKLLVSEYKLQDTATLIGFNNLELVEGQEVAFLVEDGGVNTVYYHDVKSNSWDDTNGFDMCIMNDIIDVRFPTLH